MRLTWSPPGPGWRVPAHPTRPGNLRDPASQPDHTSMMWPPWDPPGKAIPGASSFLFLDLNPPAAVGSSSPGTEVNLAYVSGDGEGGVGAAHSSCP